MKRLSALIGGLIMISGCSSTLEAYRGQTPELDLQRFFNGHLEAHGIVQDWKGEVTRRFSADILAYWEGEHGYLDERFVFSDGERQHRCWQLTKQGDHYVGRAGDVVGEARGRVVGNSLNWQYTLRIPRGDGSVDITLDDWLYLIDERNLINRTKMTKFGLKVGELTLNIRQVSEQPHRPATTGCSALAKDSD